MKGRRFSPARLLAISVLLLLAVLYLLPFYWMVATALKPLSAFYQFPPTLLPEGATLAPFVSVMVRRGFAGLLRNSLVVCLAGAGLGVAVAMLIVYPVTRMPVPPAFRRGLLNWILSLRFLPPIVVVIPFFDIVRQVGLYDSLFSLVMLYTVFSLSFTTWMMRSIFDGIPVEYEEAAIVDGMSRFRVLRKVIFPVAKGGIVATAIFAMIMSWNEFVFALTLTNLKANTLPIAMPIFDQMSIVQWEVVCAAATMIVIPMIVFAFFAQKHLIRGFTMGAVRG